MECQVEKLKHFQRTLLFEFNRGAIAARNTCAVYGDNAIWESTARKWLSRFKEDRFDISDLWRSGRPLGFDEDRLNTSIHNDPRHCTRELASVMNCDYSIIASCEICIQWERLKKSGIWVPHALSQNHINQRVAICACLLARQRLSREEHRQFLSCIVTGDEKWCLYANIRKRKEWLSANKRRICRKCSNFCTSNSIF